MKKYLILLILILVTFCRDHGVESQGNYYSTIVNLDKYQFPLEGYYYEYQFESYNEAFSSVEDYLNGFYDRGITIQDAWYSLGKESCDTSGAVVFPRFIIRTVEAETALLNLNYMGVNLPFNFECIKSIRHYSFLK